MAFEMALKKDKPMIMSDEDLEHYNAMFTACQEKFNTSKEASRIIIEGAYMSDLHIDLFKPYRAKDVVCGVIKTVYIDYEVFNALSMDKYDVVLRLTNMSDGVSVKLIRVSEAYKERQNV